MIFASMYTQGDQRGTLGCSGEDLLVEADEDGSPCGGGASDETA